MDVPYPCAKIVFNLEELVNFTITLYFPSLVGCLDKQLFDWYSLKPIRSQLHQINLSLFEEYQKDQTTFDHFLQIMIKAIQGASESTVQQILKTNKQEKKDIQSFLGGL